MAGEIAPFARRRVPRRAALRAAAARAARGRPDRPSVAEAGPLRAPRAATLPGDTPSSRWRASRSTRWRWGPVHAGIIEPGHFRFQCHGEHVFHLEISLGYQHRGVEADARWAAHAPHPRARRVRSPATPSSATPSRRRGRWRRSPARGPAARGRAAGRRAGARAARQPRRRPRRARGRRRRTSRPRRYCGALRAEFLNALAEICGNRFGRGLVVPGGVRFDLPDDAAARLAARVQDAWERVDAAAGLFFRSPSVRDRTDGAGTVDRETAANLGLVGPAARASGLAVDARRSHPFPPYDARPIPVVTGEDGDVQARAWVRFEEARHSAQFVVGALSTLPPGPVRAEVGPLAPGRITVSLVEGWRGEICHAVTTGPDGRFARYKVVDPSFHDWMGLQLACAASRSPTSRSATRASTSPTAGTIYERTGKMSGILRTPPAARARPSPIPRGRPASPSASAGGRRSAPERCRERLPRVRGGLPHRGHHRAARRAASRSTPARASSAASARRPATTAPSSSRATSGSPRGAARS